MIANVFNKNNSFYKKNNLKEIRKMKKLLAIAIVLMMVPFSAMAMETISDADLDTVTGQAGVSIAVDNVVIYTSMAKLEYTDTDAGGGTIGIANLQQTIRLNAIGGSIDEAGTAARYGLAADVTPHALTIDIASVGALASVGKLTAGGVAAMGGANATTIVIGLPTLEITIDEFTMTPYLTNGTDTTEFGLITIGAQTVAILGGELLIAAH
jgi:hypothetical protein